MTSALTDLDSLAQSLTAESAAIAGVLGQLRVAHAESASVGSVPEWAGLAQQAFSARVRALELVLLHACDALERASAGTTRAIATIAASGEK